MIVFASATSGASTILVSIVTIIGIGITLVILGVLIKGLVWSIKTLFPKK